MLAIILFPRFLPEGTAGQSVHTGLTFHPNGILSDLSLREFVRPISGTMMDWMHNFLVNGVVNLEFHLYLSRAREELGVRYEQLLAFTTSAWKWPKWQQKHKAHSEHVSFDFHGVGSQSLDPSNKPLGIALNGF